MDSIFFDATLYISGAIFHRSASLKKLYCRGVAYLDNQIYHSRAVLEHSQFFDETSFDETKFLGDARFEHIMFDSVVYFNDALFAQNTDFDNIHFKSEANFEETSFGPSTRFIWSKFYQETNFNNSIVEGLLSFPNSKLGQRISFDGSEVSQIDFTNATLPDTLSLKSIKVKRGIDLLRVKPPVTSSKCVIDLRGTATDSIKMRYDKFRLFVPDEVERGVPYDEMVNAFEGLLKNFKGKGYLSDYERLDKEYQTFKYTYGSKNSFLGYLLNVSNRYWSDYGYDKSLIWSNTLHIFLFFSFINLVRLPQLARSVYAISSINKAINKHKYLRAFRLKHKTYPALNLFAPLLALYYTGLIFFGLKMDVKEMNFSRPVSLSWIFFQYVTGLICLAYLANYVITANLIGS